MKSTSFCSINRLKKSTNLQMSQPVLARLSKFPFSGLVFCSIILIYPLLTWFSAVLNFLQNFCFKLNLPACHAQPACCHPAPQVWLETELSRSDWFTALLLCHQYCSQARRQEGPGKTCGVRVCSQARTEERKPHTRVTSLTFLSFLQVVVFWIFFFLISYFLTHWKLGFTSKWVFSHKPLNIWSAVSDTLTEGVRAPSENESIGAVFLAWMLVFVFVSFFLVV